MLNGDARARLLAIPCPYHSDCSAVGISLNRHVTWNCGSALHIDGPTVRARLRAMATLSPTEYEQ